MARLLASAALVAALVFMVPVIASGDEVPQCGPIKKTIENMKKDFGETPAIAAIVGTETPVLIFTNPDTGTFSVMTEQPGGLLCMSSSGQSWTYVKQPKDGVDL